MPKRLKQSLEKDGSQITPTLKGMGLRTPRSGGGGAAQGHPNQSSGARSTTEYIHWRVPPARSTQGPRPWFGQMQKPKESGVGINLGEIAVLGVTSATDTPATGLFCTVGSPTQESSSQQITTESGIDLSCPLVK